ncbi:MAG: TldD/PmbA family protein [Alphaproteobacteria bacterium]|nr:TldD/PmbA family protein [Alphaproteobacteria bacterium]
MDTSAAIEICRKAVAASESDDVLAVAQVDQDGSTRFANNAITQNVASRSGKLRVQVAFGRRRGVATVTGFDDASVRQAVARAEAIARLAPEDTEHLPPVEPARYRALPQGAASTAAADPARRADGVARAIAAIGDESLRAAGSYTTENVLMAFANSRAAEGAFTRSTSTFTTTVVAPTSSGWAREASSDVDDLDPERVARRARDFARLGAEPREVPPGEYRVVLAPAAVAEMLTFLLFSAQQKDADEGHSAFAGKRGTKLVSDRVTLRSVLDDPACPGVPFDQHGLPSDDIDWIVDGELRHLMTSRYWATHKGLPHTPYPLTVRMEGSDKSVEELIGSVERGLYVTRFWYTRFVDPMALLLTGMTRDGLFLIEDGKLAAGARHLRYNDSPLRVLSNIVDLGRPEVVHGYLSGRFPPLVVDGFRFTSSTSF